MAQAADLPYDHTYGRVRFTRDQCDAMQEFGILKGRYELIDGEIISKMGQNPRYGVVCVFLYAWLASVFGALFVRIQSSIDIGDADALYNQPEPDAVVTIETATAYSNRLPGPADLSLVCEVSDSTARFDRTAKSVLYARAGISEYWIVDISRRQVVLHRSPTEAGYATSVVCEEEEWVSTLARPDASIRVADLLPPAEA